MIKLIDGTSGVNEAYLIDWGGSYNCTYSTKYFQSTTNDYHLKAELLGDTLYVKVIKADPKTLDYRDLILCSCVANRSVDEITDSLEKLGFERSGYWFIIYNHEEANKIINNFVLAAIGGV